MPKTRFWVGRNRPTATIRKTGPNQYDKEGKLTGVSVSDIVTGALLHQYAYVYDASGNRKSEQIDGNVTGSAYNNLNQLTGQTGGGQMVL